MPPGSSSAFFRRVHHGIGQAESVDRGTRGSLPWTDDAKTVAPGKCSPTGGGRVRLRRRGEETRASARSGARAGGDGRGAHRDGIATGAAQKFFGEAGCGSGAPRARRGRTSDDATGANI